MTGELDFTIRRLVYDFTLREGAPPTVGQLGDDSGASPEDVTASLQRLADGRVLVLQPDGEILMAPPFSAVPTPFLVRTTDVDYYGNCSWDALGIPAMLGRDATILCSCGDCGAAAEIVVERGTVRGEGLLHFAIPARQWWNDIVFT